MNTELKTSKQEYSNLSIQIIPVNLEQGYALSRGFQEGTTEAINEREGRW